MILIINLFLYVRQRETRELLGEVSSENDCDEQAKETRCTCGKNKKNKSVSDIFCVSGKCPCHKVNHSCTRSCRCYNCKNTCNSNDVVKVKKSLKRGCRCGVGQKSKRDGGPNASHKSCQDSLRKSKCPCVAGGIGCTEVCRCFNCGNIVQARADPGKSPKRKKRNRATVSPYKRKKGSKFMISQNAEVDCGPWRNIETLCLMVCRDVMLSQGLSINSKNLRDLYDFVAKSPAVMEMSLNIAAKSTAQIAAKIAHLRSIDL
ncbi:unnamed protein product [Pocillopora meandrina]|uniref:CRC domain-containing protein n=1 Tax=Pocillopora meandrina TaxID=46732 RepID=A0AAU9Y3L0_9CNID|nr:unnamed protein product [Pocillopora meandrina]